MILLLALALLIAGFLTRRLLAPTAIHYSGDPRPKIDGSLPPLNASRTLPPVSAQSQPSSPNEALTDIDRRSLDDLIRKKSDQ